MFQKMNRGGAIRYPNWNTVLKSSFSKGESYTMPSDGWVIGQIRFDQSASGTGIPSAITINNKIVASAYGYSKPTQEDFVTITGVCAPAKKGDVVVTRSYGTYTDVKVVGCIE